MVVCSETEAETLADHLNSKTTVGQPHTEVRSISASSEKQNNSHPPGTATSGGGQKPATTDLRRNNHSQTLDKPEYDTWQEWNQMCK